MSINEKRNIIHIIIYEKNNGKKNGNLESLDVISCYMLLAEDGLQFEKGIKIK